MTDGLSIVGADDRPADAVYFWVDGELAGPHTVVARYCGRDFTAAEMRVIAELAAMLPTRRAIADAVCDTLAWLHPDGRRKDMSARRTSSTPSRTAVRSAGGAAAHSSITSTTAAR